MAPLRTATVALVAGRLQALLCGAAAFLWLEGPAVSGLVASPAAIAVDVDQAGTVERTLDLSNPGSIPVVADLKLHFANTPQRRLQGSGRRKVKRVAVVTHRPSAEEPTRLQPKGAQAAAGRSLQGGPRPRDSASGCSHPLRLLLRPRGSERASLPASRRLSASKRLARRLEAEVEGLRNSTWRHLSALGIDIADLGCAETAALGSGLVPGEELLRRVREGFDAELEFAELDRRSFFPLQAQSDPLWQSQWGMQRIGAEEAWEQLETHSGGAARPTVVAVLDTGVDLHHEDLLGHLWTNAGEVPGNGIDDDGNGYIDDVNGWDFLNSDSDPSDDDGHGTHCAGVISAAARNGVGVAGVAGLSTDVKVMAVRFLSADGGLTSDAVLALNYALAMGAEVSSHSWGGYEGSEALRTAIREAHQAGHVFVAAAGNDGTDNDVRPKYPCCYEDVPRAT